MKKKRFMDEQIMGILRVKLNAFGAFTLRAKRERTGRNPKTGEPAIISARRIVTFHASPNLVARMNGQIVQSLRG